MTPAPALAPATAHASLPSLDAMLSARTVWRAGRTPVLEADGEPTGHAGLDALLPQGGWPRAALTELLLPADGIGELALLLPTLARLTQAGDVVAVVTRWFGGTLLGTGGLVRAYSDAVSAVLGAGSLVPGIGVASTALDASTVRRPV